MTASSNEPASATSSGNGLRLQLSDSAPPGHVDGAWWPRSRDLQREAADLVDHFPAEIGRISRLLFSRPDWDNASHGRGIRAIRAARGRVKVGSFPSDDTHLMILTLGSGQRLKLLVIPSDTPAADGEQRLRAVNQPGAMAADGAVDWDRWDNESPSV